MARNRLMNKSCFILTFLLGLIGLNPLAVDAALAKYSLTVTKTGSGTVTSAPSGISCGSTCSRSFSSGTTVTLWTDPAPGYTFKGWGGNCSGTGNCVLSMNSKRYVTATFIQNSGFTLNVSNSGNGVVTSAPSGINCGSSCNYAFSSGNIVTLWTAPDSGYRFIGWSGDCSGTGDCVLSMNAPHNIAATFAPIASYALGVTKTGNGKITSAPAGIDCGSTCAYSYSSGNAVTLWTTPDTGYRFSGWSGDCSGTGDCVLSMNAPHNISATFTPIASYALTVIKTGNGKVTSAPAGIDCGITCIYSFQAGTSAILSAQADPGFSFLGWSGSCTGTGTCTITLDGAKSVTAMFTGSAPPSNLPLLKRGINLSHWLTHYGRQPVVKADMILIKNAGFDHVRIPFDPAYLGWNPDNLANAGSMPQIGSLDAAVDLAISNGLVAVVDFHPGSSLKNRIETDSAVQDAYIKLWTSLAERYKGKPQASLVYELLNEPQYWNNGPATWYVLRQKVLTALRSKDTQHMILLSGGYGGGLRGILEDPGVTDSAVGYTFHYYQPYLFTHNGAPWEPHLSQIEDTFTGLRYPAALNTMDNIKPKTGTDLSAITIAFNEYVAQNWAYQRIHSDIEGVKTWATNHGNAKVYCNEFGVLRLTQDEASRSSYLKDVRTAVESFGMGWTVFDYADIFGIAKATGSTYLSGDGAIVPSDSTNPKRVFTTENLDGLVK